MYQITEADLELIRSAADALNAARLGLELTGCFAIARNAKEHEDALGLLIKGLEQQRDKLLTELEKRSK